jgi:hypothetical protein
MPMVEHPMAQLSITESPLFAQPLPSKPPYMIIHLHRQLMVEMVGSMKTFTKLVMRYVTNVFS